MQAPNFISQIKKAKIPLGSNIEDKREKMIVINDSKIPSRAAEPQVLVFPIKLKFNSCKGKKKPDKKC